MAIGMNKKGPWSPSAEEITESKVEKETPNSVYEPSPELSCKLRMCATQPEVQERLSEQNYAYIINHCPRAGQPRWEWEGQIQHSKGSEKWTDNGTTAYIK